MRDRGKGGVAERMGGGVYSVVGYQKHSRILKCHGRGEREKVASLLILRDG